jgi:hypothetical protein
MPSAVEGDQLVLIVAIGTGDDEHDTPADWTEEHVAGTDDIALYVYTRKAGVGGAGGTSVSTTTGSNLVASAIGFNFGQNTDVEAFAPDGNGNSSFDLKHQSFTGSIPSGVTFCSIACWEFARTLSVWPIDYPNNREAEEQNNCNLAAAVSNVTSSEPSRPDFTINNAAKWSGVGFYVKPSGTTPTAVSLLGIKVPTAVDSPNAGAKADTTLDGVTVGTRLDEPTAGSVNSVSLNGITLGTRVENIGSSGATSVNLNGISVDTSTSAIQVTAKNSVSLNGITLGTAVEDIGSEGVTNLAPNGITVRTGVPSPSAGNVSNVSLNGVTVRTRASDITGGYTNPPASVTLDGIAVGTGVTDDLESATYAEPNKIFWCCCDTPCVCNLIGDIYGPENGEPDCQGKIDIVPNPCDAEFDYEKVLWQVVRTSDDPEQIVLDGDYNDYVAARDDDSYLRFYMTAGGSYELRLWYQNDGHAPPCIGLPDENNKFTRTAMNVPSCCDNSCPIDLAAIRSTVTLSGWTNEAFEVPGDFPPYTLTPGTPLFGVYNCDLRDPDYYDEYQYNNLDIFNHTNSTLEYKIGDTAYPNCIISRPTPKIVLLGDFDTYHFRHFTNVADPGVVAATAKFRAWGYFGNLVPAAGGGIETEADGTPSLGPDPSLTYRVVVQCLEDVRGTFYNSDFSSWSWPAPFLELGPDHTDEFFDAKNMILRPCLNNYSSEDEIPALLPPGGGSLWWIPPREDFEVGDCRPAWGNYDKDPKTYRSPPNPRATWTVS